MQIQKLSLSNFQNYSDETIEFEDGISVFYGLNGSGKSTILRAIFAGLFQSDACSEIPSGSRFTIEDFRQNGTEHASVELTISHENNTYTIVWNFSDSTESCTLKNNGNLIAEGVSEVGKSIKNLLNMDAEAFVNSTYIQQTELMRLISAKPAERKKVFDALLGLDEIESYIDRANEARLGAKDRAQQLRSDVKSEQNQLSSKPTESELRSQITSIQTQIETTKTKQKKIEDQLSSLTETLQEYESAIENIESLEAEKEELESKISTASEQKQVLNSRLQTTKEKQEELHKEQRELLKNTQFSTLKEAFEELPSPITTEEEQRLQQMQDFATTPKPISGYHQIVYSDIQSHISSISVEVPFQDYELQFDQQIYEINPEKFSVGSAIKQLQEKTEQLERDIEHINDRIEDKQQFMERMELTTDNNTPLQLSAGFWNPEVDPNDIEKVDSDRKTKEILQEIRSELENGSEFKNLQEHVNELYTSYHTGDIETKKEEVENEILSLREDKREKEKDLSKIENEITILRDSVQPLVQYLQKAIKSSQMWVKSQLERKQLASSVADLRSQLSEAQQSISQHSQDISNQEDQISDLQSKLDRITNQLSEAQENTDIDAESLQKKQQQLQDKQAELSDRIPELQAEKKTVQQTQEDVQNIRSRIKTVESKIDTVETVQQEFKSVQETYESVQKSFRKEFVAGINEYANDIFRNVYQNDRYDRIIVDEDYSITIYTQDNELIKPDLSSGGEAALINMTLRAAVYRVVSQMNGSNSDTLPPIILDEPTTYLDSGHISKLGEFVKTLKSWGVRQVFIVSHNQDLIKQADTTYTVSINEKTGKSAVTKEKSMRI